jgi:hypothetical protein
MLYKSNYISCEEEGRQACITNYEIITQEKDWVMNPYYNDDTKARLWNKGYMETYKKNLYMYMNKIAQFKS